MNHDRQCRMLAEHFLRDYQLSGQERAEELERLADTIQRAAEAELESIEHRRRA
jgi:hypothetical protein